MSDSGEPTEGYVKATLSAEQGGPHAGEIVEVLADDYAAKGDEELIEIKVGDDLIFVEKKHVKLGSAALEKPEAPKEADAPVEEKPKEDDKLEEDEDDEDDEKALAFDDLVDDMLDDDDVEDNDDDDVKDDDDDDDDDVKDDDEPKIEFEVPDEIKVPQPGTDLEVLRAKLRKSLEELEDIRSDMSASFTSTSTISSTIQSIKGMLDALKKDQMSILSREQ